MKEELDDERRSRERQDERNRVIASREAEDRRVRIEQKALEGGSRFNVHFRVIDAVALTPQTLVEALRKFVDFSDSERNSPGEDGYVYLVAGYKKSGVVRVGPSSLYLKEGLGLEEVLELLGQPTAISERNEQGLVIKSYEFPRRGGRILIVEFVDGRLHRSRIETLQPNRSGSD